MTSGSRAVLEGLLIGAGVACGITVTRWLTWIPYDSVLVPYDLGVLSLAFALIRWAGIVLARRLISERAADAACVAAVWAVSAGAWAGYLQGSGGGIALKAAAAGLVLIAALLLARNALRGKDSRANLLWAPWLPAAGLALSLGLYPWARAASLIFPAALIASALPGLPRARHSRRALVASAAAVAVTATIGLVAIPPNAWQPAPDVGPAAGPSAILIVLDTVRRDHLSLYGYHRSTTPRLDRWARGALVFEEATATSSWTLPSHASIFTGLYPRSHGAHGHRGPNRWGNALALSPERVTVAEIARDAGWATAAIVANHFYLARSFGVEQGFDSYQELRPRRGLRFQPSDWLASRLEPEALAAFRWPYFRSEQVTDRAIRWLRAAGPRPYFLFVNYMDAHIPNRRPPTQLVPREDEDPPEAHGLDRIALPPGRALPDSVRRYLVNGYDRELMALDESLGRFLDFVNESEQAGRVTVFITSDHGEYLGEHGLFDHSKHLHREVLDVPLIVKGPGIGPGRRAGSVQIVDLFPMILDSLGLAVPPGTQGVSPLRGVRDFALAEWYASENGAYLDPKHQGRFDRDLRTLQEGPHKLFMDGRGGIELFDLNTDPEELVDLSSRLPDIRAWLEARLGAWLAAHPGAADAAPHTLEIDEDQLDRLRSLGYVR